MPDFLVVIGVFHVGVTILAGLLLLAGMIIAIIMISTDAKTSQILAVVLFMAIIIGFVLYVPAKFYIRTMGGPVWVMDQTGNKNDVAPQ